MDLFMQLNYRYHQTPNATRPHVSQRLQGSPHHVPIPDIQTVQDQLRPEDGYTASDPSRTTHRGTLVDLRSPVDSDPKHLMKPRYMDEFANLVDQYIPSSSDKITCTDHRPFDEIFGQLRPSSGLSHATVGSPWHLLQNGAPHGHPRQTTLLTYALPTKPQLDGVLQIPLLAVDNRLSGTGLVVDFRCSDWGIGVEMQGIPMSDLLYGNVSSLESPHQRVFDGLDVSSLRFNILWPHYPPFAKVISGFGADGKSITRAELGYEVSLAFAEFFYHITSHSLLPAQPGPYAISPSHAGLPSSGIKFEKLHLITVRNTSRGEWMAEIRVVLMS